MGVKREAVPRSFTRISPPFITSLCMIINAFLSFKIFFFSGSKRPKRSGFHPPARFARLFLTSWTVVWSVISMLVGSFLIGFFAAAFMLAGDVNGVREAEAYSDWIL